MKKVFAATLALASVSLGFVGTTVTSDAAVKSPTVLTEETNVGVTFTNNFNPANGEATGTQMGINALSYEPLIQYNTLKANVWYPWIAKSVVMSATGQSAVITMNPKAFWSNGTPVTATDVANEFNAINTNAGMNVFGVPALTAPARVSGNTVTLTFATPQFSNEDAIGSVMIFPVQGDTGIPAADQISSGTQYLSNTQVLGNGPYLPTRYTSQEISYTYNSHWKLTATPYVTGVNVPYYASNAAATEALASHQLDWAGNDIPQVQNTFVRLNPSTNHFYYPPGSTVTLWFNVSSSAPDASTDCLADPSFRYALSMAVNRNELASVGETGFELPATSSSGLMPIQSAYEGAYKNNYQLSGWSSTKVATYLESKGYAMDANHYFAVNSAAAQTATGLAAGTECHFSIQDPTAYSDYEEDEQLLAATFKADHINVTPLSLETGQWNTDIFTHQFDAIVHWGAGGLNPYIQYSNWLENPALTGGSTNYGEYQNAAAQIDLVQLASAQAGTPAFQNAINKLAAIMTTEVPMAPILYGADWDVYSTARFSGWVTPSNQYAYPGPGTEGVSYVITHLTKA